MEKIAFPKLEKGQVALIFSKFSTGQVLNLENEFYLGKGEVYQVFDSLIFAKEYAKKRIDNDSNLECCIMSEMNEVILYLNPNEEKEFEL